MTDRIYTLFVGVNGAGKTSLYSILASQDDLGERVNIDEIAGGIGSWRDALVQLRAARQAMRLIRQYTESNTPFHQEAAIPTPTLLRQVKAAKARGFRVRLYFVGVEGLQVAINRVHRRVDRGGHGIDESVISRRYEKITEHLGELLELCDVSVFYDNTVSFRQIAVLDGNRIADMDRRAPAWFTSRILPIIQGMKPREAQPPKRGWWPFRKS